MISVIVPVYNGERGIIRCLESIKNQTYKDFECIIIDDGSSDRSYKKINDWINDNRFRLYREENSGAAAARNNGIEHAEGEFLAFVDQDDFISKDYLEKMVLAVSGDTDIVVSGYSRVKEDGKIMFKVSLEQGEWSRFIVTAPWAHLYRTDFIRKHGLHFLDSRIGEDVYFNVLAYLNTGNVKILPETCDYKWVYNESSVSNSSQKKAGRANDPFILLNTLFNDMPAERHVSDDIIEYFFIRYCIWYILYVMKGSCREDNLRIQKKLFNWVKEKFPDFEKNPYIRKKPEGELTKYHAAVKVWMSARKMGFDRVITKVFSERKR